MEGEVGDLFPLLHLWFSGYRSKLISTKTSSREFFGNHFPKPLEGPVVYVSVRSILHVGLRYFCPWECESLGNLERDTWRSRPANKCMNCYTIYLTKGTQDTRPDRLITGVPRPPVLLRAKPRSTSLYIFLTFNTNFKLHPVRTPWPGNWTPKTVIEIHQSQS